VAARRDQGRAALALWPKDIAPSTELRTWLDAHPDGFDEFAKRYRAELDTNPAVGRLREIEGREPRVSLPYSVRDPVHNHAAVLADFLPGLDS